MQYQLFLYLSDAAISQIPSVPAHTWPHLPSQLSISYKINVAPPRRAKYPVIRLTLSPRQYLPLLLANYAPSRLMLPIRCCLGNDQVLLMQLGAGKCATVEQKQLCKARCLILLQSVL